MFGELYGLSCVENQVLAILKGRGNAIVPLYHQCAIPLKELFFFLVVKGEDPYYFSCMPRIQDELKQLGLLNICLKKPQNRHSLQDLICNCKENEYVLLRVTPEFTKSELHARGFRNDHFVRIAPQENGFVIYNDIPETVITVPADKLDRISGGECLLVAVNGKVDEKLKQELWNDRLFKAEKYVPTYFQPCDLEEIEDFPARLRNMMLMYKLLRYRLADYYGQYTNTAFIRQMMPSIERYNAKAEYYNLKQNATRQQLYELLHNVNLQEVELMNVLKERLEEL